MDSVGDGDGDGDSDVLDRTSLRDRTRQSWNEGDL